MDGDVDGRKSAKFDLRALFMSQQPTPVHLSSFLSCYFLENNADAMVVDKWNIF
jgi:hypothetical protein